LAKPNTIRVVQKDCYLVQQIPCYQVLYVNQSHIVVLLDTP